MFDIEMEGLWVVTFLQLIRYGWRCTHKSERGSLYDRSVDGKENINGMETLCYSPQ